MNTHTYHVTRDEKLVEATISPFTITGEEYYVAGLCVVFTILRRLDRIFQHKISVGGMSISFGWTKEQASQFLTEEASLPQAEAVDLIEILTAWSPAIIQQNDMEVFELLAED